MPKYLCLQRGLPGGTQDGEKPSPSQMQAMSPANPAELGSHRCLRAYSGRLGR
jgi:hypothetical protein